MDSDNQGATSSFYRLNEGCFELIVIPVAAAGRAGAWAGHRLSRKNVDGETRAGSIIGICPLGTAALGTEQR